MNDIQNAPMFFPDLMKTIETNSKIQEYIAWFVYARLETGSIMWLGMVGMVGGRWAGGRASTQVSTQ
jgi:hypothetical protein